MDSLLEECRVQMQKALDVLATELGAIRTGRVSVHLLDGIRVDVYGSPAPISNVASVTVSDSKNLVVTVWDANNVSAVDNALRTSHLGVNPRLEGNKLYLSFPDLTEERRQELGKLASKKAEEIKIRVRNVRRDINEDLKKINKDKELSDDELKTALEKIQQITDDFISKIDQAYERKKQDLLSF